MIISSTPRNGSGSRCRGSSEIAAFQRRPVLVCELAHGLQLTEHQRQIRGSQSRQQLLALHSQRPIELPGLGLPLLGHLNQHLPPIGSVSNPLDKSLRDQPVYQGGRGRRP
jgi:hypothetical protein